MTEPQRIKPREIRELPRHCRRRAADGLGQLNNQRVPNVDSTEGDLAVEIKGNDELFASPVTPRHKVTNRRKDSTSQLAKSAGYVTSPLICLTSS